MQNNEFLFEDMNDLKAKAVEILQERLFGLPDKKKTKDSFKDAPQKKTREGDPEITPKYISNLLNMIKGNTQEIVEKFIESEYDKTIHRIKQQNPKAFEEYLLHERGGNEQEFRAEFISGFWRDLAKSHGVRVAEDKTQEDIKSKHPFMQAFEDSLFNKDIHPDVSNIIQYKFADDLREVDKYYHVLEELTTDRGKVSRVGFSDESALKQVVANKLAIIRLGLLFLKDDPRFIQAFPEVDGKNSQKMSVSKSGQELIQQELLKFASKYPKINPDAHRIADAGWYKKLKAVSPEKYAEKGLNPFDIAVEALSKETEEIIRNAKTKEREAREGGDGGEDEGSKFVRATKTGVEDPESQISPESRPTPQSEPQPESEKLESTEKEKEVDFANNRHHRRQMMSFNSGQSAISAVENPEKIFNLSEDDFRDMKTIFAYNNPFHDQSKEKFKQSILSSTRAEFVKFLKNLHQDPDQLASFVTLWNSERMVGGKLSTYLLKGENHGTKKTTAKAKAKAKAKATTKEKEISPKISTKTQPSRRSQSKKSKDSGIGLSDKDLKDAALQSSKGLDDFLKGGGKLEL